MQTSLIFLVIFTQLFLLCLNDTGDIFSWTHIILSFTFITGIEQINYSNKAG